MALFSRKNLINKNKYNITKHDMVNQLEGFPVGVVVRMMEEQELQGNKPDVTVFQRHRFAGKREGGFSWGRTEKGNFFWIDVLDRINLDLFFEQYPEYAEYNLA